MRAGKLLDAEKKLLLCGGPQCPAAMHPDCERWLSSVEASTPTVVVHVSSTLGPLTKDVRFSVDGGDTVPVDGRAIGVDPGAHELTVEATGYWTATKPFVVSEGEKLHSEVVALTPLAPLPTNDSRARPTPSAPTEAVRVESHVPRLTLPIVIISSGAALAGISAVYFGVRARADDRQLANCTPDCSQAAVDHVKREYLWTNLSIGLAAAGITTAALLFLIHGHSAKQPTTALLGIGVGTTGFGPMATGTF
jgi:hypothetical protein